MAVDPILAGGILGGLNLGSSLISDHFNRRQSRAMQDKQNQANLELSKYAFQKDMQQLKYMNEYNAPVNQVARMREAGLNPALMYKGSPQNVQTQMPKFNAPQANIQHFPMQAPQLPTMGDFQDMRIKHAQVNNLKKDEEIKNLQALEKVQAIRSKTFDNDLKSELRKYSVDTAISMATKRSNEAAQSYQQTQLNSLAITDRGLNAEIKRLELKLMRKGIYRNDPAWIRAIIQNINLSRLQKETQNKIIKMR